MNFAEFFATTSEAITFLFLIGWENFNWIIVLGLLIGGMICAPMAAYVCKKIPQRILGVLVGVTILILSIRMILKFAGLM